MKDLVNPLNPFFRFFAKILSSGSFRRFGPHGALLAIPMAFFVSCEAGPPSLTLSAPAETVAGGATMQMTATFNDPGAGVVDLDVTASSFWWTLNSQVATVNGSGLVTGEGLGLTKVSVEYEGLTAESALTVTSAPAALTVSPASGTLSVGETIQLLAVSSELGNVSGVAVWSSSNPSVASVDNNGRVTGRGGATATVTATFQGATGATSWTVVVPIAPAPIAAGEEHALATKTDGTLWAWGWGPSGELGDGTSTSRSVPTQVCQNYDGGIPACLAPMTNVVAVAAGSLYSLALKADGTLWGWGNNGDGQLGDGTTIGRATPTQVCQEYDAAGATCTTYFTGVAQVAAGDWHALALKQDGSVWAWGQNGDGNLGDGTTDPSLVPVRVCAAGQTAPCTSFLEGVAALGGGGQYHSAVLKGDGTVWSFGAGFWGALGNGVFDALRSVPDQACVAYSAGQCTAFLTGVVKVHTGAYATYALRADGTVWNWGKNDSWEVSGAPDASGDINLATQEINGFTDWVDVTGGIYTAAGLRFGGTAWGWGDNTASQFGRGDSVSPFDGVTYQTCAPGQTFGCGVFINGLVEIDSSWSYHIALRGDGALFLWGDNASGQIGAFPALAVGTDALVPIREATGATDWGAFNP